MTCCSVSQNVRTELDQDPTFQTRSRDIYSPRPSNMAATSKTLLSGANAIKVWWWSVFREVRSRGSGVCSNLCENHLFFVCRQRTEVVSWLPTALLAVSVRWREILFCFLFSDPIIIGPRNCLFSDSSLAAWYVRYNIQHSHKKRRQPHRVCDHYYWTPDGALSVLFGW